MSLPKYFAGVSKWWKLLLAAVLITFVWLYLWYFPWQANLHHIFWLQLGLGLTIFIAPGFCIYGLLSNRPNLEFNHVTFGFVISHLIFAILGILGRIIHLSFEAITFIMMTVGLILLLLYVLPKINRGFKFQMDWERSTYVLSILPLLLVFLLVSLIVIQRMVSDDDLTYLAYITNFQYSTHLDFNGPIFGGFQLAPSRFWLMSVPFAQAFLAETSKLPGILILGGYYEPFLVILSILCWYELAIMLKLPPKAASASVILQLSFLLLLSEYLHPGSPYFNQLSADKATAAFILAPVFFQSLIKMLEGLTRNNMILLLLAGFSLALMHPIMLAYSVFIGGMLILLNKNSRGLKNKFIPMIVLMIFMIPYIVIRFVNVPAVKPISFDPEVILTQSGSDNLIAPWRNTRFYGFNPSILTMRIPYEADIPLSEPILKWGWILVPISAAVLALRQRGNGVAQFILSCFVLCFLAGFPFTGWIIGYFLHARMLARSVWLFPFGLSSVYIALVIRDYVKARKIFAKIHIHPNWLLLMVTAFAIGMFSLYIRENDLSDFEKFTAKSQRYQGLAVAGQELDRRISDYAYVVGSQQLNDLIPGISSKSKLITFRISKPGHMPYYSDAQREERISDTKKIFAKALSPEDKMALLEKYDIQFLFLQSFDLRLFTELIARYPDRVKVIETGGMVILQINEDL